MSSIEVSLDKIRKSSYFWLTAFVVVAAGQWFQVRDFVTAQGVVNGDQKALNQQIEQGNMQRDVAIAELKQQSISMDRRLQLMENRQK